MTTPYVGMKVWTFDQSHRVYARDAKGKAIGGPIWREHWVPLEIVGETSRSWLVGHEWARKNPERATKIAKAAWPANLAVSQEDIDRRAFVETRHGLARTVENCRDYDTLKTIEAALAGQPK